MQSVQELKPKPKPKLKLAANAIISIDVAHPLLTDSPTIYIDSISIKDPQSITLSTRALAGENPVYSSLPESIDSIDDQIPASD